MQVSSGVAAGDGGGKTVTEATRGAEVAQGGRGRTLPYQRWLGERAEWQSLHGGSAVTGKGGEALSGILQSRGWHLEEEGWPGRVLPLRASSAGSVTSAA